MQKRLTDKLTNAWLWIVAVLMTVLIVSTLAAWIGGIIFFIWEVLHG